MTRKGELKRNRLDRGYSIHRKTTKFSYKRGLTIAVSLGVGVLLMMFISSPNVFHYWINNIGM